MLGVAPAYKLNIGLRGTTPQSWARAAAQASPPKTELPVFPKEGEQEQARWLSEHGFLPESTLLDAINQVARGTETLIETLSRSLPELRDAFGCLSAHAAGSTFLNPGTFRLNPGNQSLLPTGFLEKSEVYPLFQLGSVLTLAMLDPGDLETIDQVRMRTGCRVESVLVNDVALNLLLHPDESTGGVQGTKRVLDHANVKLVDALVRSAAECGASDVHVEPEKDFTRVRFRIDDLLTERRPIPQEQHAAVVSRIKVMAQLDISATRRPQDGHFQIRSTEGTLDVRVSTLPTVCGENVVLRIVNTGSKALSLDELGMGDDALFDFRRHLAQPNGMLLVTGPTGSGKSTTLYGALAELSTIERNVVTIEDPVERAVPLLRQTEVNPKAGITFANGLRSILRQDPDVIMVGEIRDPETAEIAIQAALTGHLVLSTLHANSAAEGIARIAEMGVPAYLLTSAIRAIVGQRLVRRICDECAVEAVPPPELVEGLDLVLPPSGLLPVGKGCPACNGTGYRGRVGLYEVLELTPELARALLEGAGRDVIARIAEDSCSTNIRTNGRSCIAAGLTTVDELARVIGLTSPVKPKKAA